MMSCPFVRRDNPEGQNGVQSDAEVAYVAITTVPTADNLSLARRIGEARFLEGRAEIAGIFALQVPHFDASHGDSHCMPVVGIIGLRGKQSRTIEPRALLRAAPTEPFEHLLVEGSADDPKGEFAVAYDGTPQSFCLPSPEHATARPPRPFGRPISLSTDRQAGNHEDTQ